MSVDGPARAKEEDDRHRYELVYTLLGHQRSVSAIAISPDGTMLASCGADGLIKLWSLATGALRATLRAPATTSLGGPEGMEDAKGGAGVGVGVASGLSDVAWSSDGRYIVSGGDDRMVRVWDAVRVSASFSSLPPPFSRRAFAKADKETSSTSWFANLRDTRPLSFASTLALASTSSCRAASTRRSDSGI